MLALPLVLAAADTDATLIANQRNNDFATGKKALVNKNWQATIDAFGRAVKAEPRNANFHNYLAYAYVTPTRWTCHFSTTTKRSNWTRTTVVRMNILDGISEDRQPCQSGRAFGAA